MIVHGDDQIDVGIECVWDIWDQSRLGKVQVEKKWPCSRQ